MTGFDDLDEITEIQLQAAAFRALRAHLQKRTDVQNIDMMNLTGFCRNCLSKWIEEEAHKKGLNINKQNARKYVYGMEYEKWRDKYQTKISPEQQTNPHNNTK